MSNLSPAGRPIPMGILVARRAKKPEKPASMHNDSSVRQLPWLHLGIGGSVAWIVAIAAIAYLANTPGEAQQPVGPDGPMNAPIIRVVEQGEPRPFVPPRVAEFNAEPVPKVLEVAEPAPRIIEPAPKLVRQVPPPQVDEAPPRVKVIEEPAKPVAPAVPVPPPEAPAPEPKVAKKPADAKFANCEQIGTNIRFFRDPPEAFKQARAEKKLVFMVHLSGNLEDKDFT